jgi:hypothetical protein
VNPVRLRFCFELGDDVVRAGPARPLHRAQRGERPGRVARLDWGQAASAGPRWAAPE